MVAHVKKSMSTKAPCPPGLLADVEITGLAQPGKESKSFSKQH